MFAICIESSHSRGMGHLFRAVVLSDYLISNGEKCVIVLNNDEKSVRILNNHKLESYIIDDIDIGLFIRAHEINVWIMDRFESNEEICRKVKNEGILLVGIDDSGKGARYFDIHFCGLFFGKSLGEEVCRGNEYIILNPEIEKYRRLRTCSKKIMVTLGGTDTYGVTLIILEILRKNNISADIYLGPGFEHYDMLNKLLDDRYKVFFSVESLIESMSGYDLAITGGGMTCVEANASGLPCVIVANEVHEITIAQYIASFGGAVFAGYYQNIQSEIISHINELNVSELSKNALSAFDLKGINRIYTKIQERIKQNG